MQDKAHDLLLVAACWSNARAASHMMEMDVDEFLSYFAEDVRRIRAEVFDEKETLQ